MKTAEELKEVSLPFLEEESKKYEVEFNRVLDHKKAAELIFERIMNPKKYPDFHYHLDVTHEIWIREFSKYKR